MLPTAADRRIDHAGTFYAELFTGPPVADDSVTLSKTSVTVQDGISLGRLQQCEVHACSRLRCVAVRSTDGVVRVHSARVFARFCLCHAWDPLHTAHPRVCARVVAQGHRRTGKWERPSLAGALSGRRGAARHATGRISFEFVRPAVAGFINAHYNQTLSIFGEPSDTIWAVGSIASATPMCVDSGAAPGWRWRTVPFACRSEDVAGFSFRAQSRRSSLGRVPAQMRQFRGRTCSLRDSVRNPGGGTAGPSGVLRAWMRSCR